jgi:hypothetical protein
VVIVHPFESVIRQLLQQWANFPERGHYSYGPVTLLVDEDGSFTIRYDAKMGLGPLAD